MSRRQLLREGFDAAAITWMLGAKDLFPLFAGVYAVGRPDINEYGRSWAAVLATRGIHKTPHRRALGHASAAAIEGIRPFPAQPEIVVQNVRLNVPGITIRRTNALPDEDVRMDENRLPWTTWTRTLSDLSTEATAEEIRDDLDACERLEILDVAAIEALMKRRRGKAGHAKLNEALDLYRELPEAVYLSLLERLGTRLVAVPGIPAPEINGPVTLGDSTQIRVDLLLRAAKVAVELDGGQHLRAKQRSTDRYRDRELVKLGYLVLRFGWRDVQDDPDRVVGDILVVLAGRGV